MGAVLFSCKKDRLKGDYEILVGEWDLIYSVEFKTYTDPSITIVDTIFSSEMNAQYKCTFHKKGKVEFLRDSESIENLRTVFSDFNSNHNAFYPFDLINCFRIQLNNKDERRIDGCLNHDSLGFTYRGEQFDGLPYFNHEEGYADINYYHYFKKKQ